MFVEEYYINEIFIPALHETMHAKVCESGHKLIQIQLSTAIERMYAN